jgi:23S rRNA (pseudouridine1915-N3)-methyltransferase
MRVVLAGVSTRAGKSKLPAVDAIVEEYLGRLSAGAGRWLEAESRIFATEAALLQASGGAGSGSGGGAKSSSKARSKTPATLVLLDGGGRQMSSEQFAAWLAARRDAGVQELWLAVGPADGWSGGALAVADLKLSLGAMTLAHELARAVAAEQLYRAWAILERHPYHRGH